ncbi:alpha/beta fold hydrolase [Thermofilum sp.]|jgi:dipeptidyl aminopeptidase/acylaminoacyl peptidase|uniref:alpha/beta fold hydrolase n=2 Tax=Thermofilum sp. TaxID=1961369 RepID=UPI00258A63C9|nr:alpha/beta fold hydrolase [Thermofilum sp.]
MLTTTAIIYLLITIIAAILLVVYIISSSASKKLATPPRKTGSWSPGDLGFEYEKVEVKTADGLTLRGWLIPRGSEKTVIVVHGYTSCKWDEWYMKPVINILARHDFNVVAFDMRAHGESDGEKTTLGYREVDDIGAIINYLKERGLASRLGIIGYSMGGAITLMSLARYEELKAGVADSPYIDIRASGKRWINRVGAPLRYILLASYPLIMRLTASRTGASPEKLVMYQYAKSITKPLLIIGGQQDDLVAIDEVRKFYEEVKKVNSNVELWETTSKHVSAIQDYPREYEERIVGFFNRWL